MRKLIDFIKKMLSGDNSVSSKRFMALMAFICVVVMAFVGVNNQVILYFLGFICTLSGFGSFEKFSRTLKS